MTTPGELTRAHALRHDGHVRVIVADDHPVVLLGISKLIEVEPDIDLVAAVSSITELNAALMQLTCHVLICDYSFDDDCEPDGIQLLERLQRQHPAVKIVILSSHDDLMVVRQVLQLGVAGFLSKASQDLSELPRIIRSVTQGDQYVDPQTSRLLVEHMFKTGETDRGVRLSPREVEVLRLFAKGTTVSKIAEHTHRSLKTISAQKKSAMAKLGVANDVELIHALRKMK